MTSSITNKDPALTDTAPLLAPFPADDERLSFVDVAKQQEVNLNGREIKALSAPLLKSASGKLVIYKNLTQAVIIGENCGIFNPYALMGDTSSSLDIYIAGRRRIWQVQMDPLICQKLVSLLYGERPHPKFCCVDFVNALYGKWNSDDVNFINWNEWNVRVSPDGESLLPGQAVFLTEQPVTVQEGIVVCDSDPTVRHLAVYIGSDCYLSQIGTTGIFVSSLAGLHRLYKTSFIYAMTTVD